MMRRVGGNSLLADRRPPPAWPSASHPPRARKSLRGRDKKDRSPSHQPIGKIADGLAIHASAIPFIHRLEIRRAFAVRLAHPKASGMQQIGGGGEHVGDAVTQVDATVAVEIDAVFDV